MLLTEDPRVREAIRRVSSSTDRARLVDDLVYARRSHEQLRMVAMGVGLVAGAGLGLWIGPRFLGGYSPWLSRLLVITMFSGTAMMMVAVGVHDLAQHFVLHGSPLRAASIEVSRALALKTDDSRYWRRRGRLERLMSVARAFTRAGIPADGLKRVGPAELESSVAWAEVQQQALDLLVRAYEGEFLAIDAEPGTGEAWDRWTPRITKVGAVMALLVGIVTLLGTVVEMFK
jgi:hypothetical protein